MYIGERQRALLLLIVVIISIVVLAWWAPLSGQIPSRWVGATQVQGLARSAPLKGDTKLFVDQAQLASQIELEQHNLYSNESPTFKEALVTALAYAVGRFETMPKAGFKVIVNNDPGCVLRGVTHPEQRIIQIDTCDSISSDRTISILAHEFVHLITYDRYGPTERSDLILVEGMATWSAASYWLGGQPNLRIFVRQQRAAGVFFPLATDYTSQGEGVMNAMYYEWASFVDFLIGTYGRTAFDQVYRTGTSAPGSADYHTAYGKDLAALEQEWLAWLDQ